MADTNNISGTKKKWFKKRLFLVALLILLTGTFYFSKDYSGAETISLTNNVAFGLPCLSACELVVQEYDKDGNLWASRGMIIYKLEKGDNKFRKIAHVPTGFSIFWLRNFSIIRKLTLRPECIEVVVTSSGNISALSAGKIWLLKKGEKIFKETLKLTHYGFGDQGIRNDGLLNLHDSVFLFGEYFINPDHAEVRLFKSTNNQNSWDAIYKFRPGQIRHIHAVQKDPYSDRLWVCTGDVSEESIIAWSDDEFQTINIIGQGSQVWRVCQLVFTEDAVIWGTDTGRENVAGIYRWDRKTAELKQLKKIDGIVFFGTLLKNGTIVMSTNREGMRIEKDDKTRLFIISEHDSLEAGASSVKTIECGTWNHKNRGFWFKFAMLRFQRDQGGAALAITCLNQKELPDGELIIISEETLQSPMLTSKLIER